MINVWLGYSVGLVEIMSEFHWLVRFCSRFCGNRSVVGSRCGFRDQFCQSSIAWWDCAQGYMENILQSIGSWCKLSWFCRVVNVPLQYIGKDLLFAGNAIVQGLLATAFSSLYSILLSLKQSIKEVYGWCLSEYGWILRVNKLSVVLLEFSQDWLWV